MNRQKVDVQKSTAVALRNHHTTKARWEGVGAGVKMILPDCGLGFHSITRFSE
jgi:hypothetical protein